MDASSTGQGPGLGPILPSCTGLLLVAAAFINQGVIGLAILLFAEAWLLVLAPLAVQGRAIGASRQLWRGLVGLVSVVALLMIAAQVAYTSHVPALESVLRFLGLTKVRSRAGLAQAILPVALSFAAGLTQVSSLTQLEAAVTRLARDGFELRSVGPQQRSPRPAFVLSSVDVVSLAVQLTAVLAAPCALALPLLAALSVTVWAGASFRARRPDGSASPALICLSALHVYSGLVVLALFLWQLADRAAGPRAAAAGLVRFQDWAGLTPAARLRQLALLTAFGTLTATRLERIGGLVRRRSARSALDTAAGPSVGQALARVLPAALELAAGTLGAAARAVPAALPCALLGLALALPSLAGLVLASLALPGVLSLGGQPPLLAYAAAACLQLWTLGCYLATAWLPVRAPGAVAAEAGLLALSPAGRAAGLLGAMLALGALLVTDAQWRRRRDAAPDEPDQGPRSPLLPSAGAPPVAARLRARLPSSSGAGVWRRLLWLLTCAAWYAGFPAVYGLQYALGSLRYDGLHAGYLVGLLMLFGGHAVLLRPRLRRVPDGRGPVYASHTHGLLRAAVSLHFVLFYAAMLVYKAFPGGAKALAWPVWRWIGVGDDLAPLQGLPLVGLLFLAAAHDMLTRRIAGHWRHASQHSVLGEFQYPGTSSAARVAVSYGPTMLSLLVYALLLADCRLSALGLVYLALALAALVWQPRRGRWVNVDGCLVLDGSPLVRWLPLTLLSCLACADFALQLALPAAVANPWWAFPPEVARFLEHIGGFSHDQSRREAAVQLLRPTLILGALSAYRWLFGLGTLREQLEGQIIGPEGLEQKRLREQYGFKAFCKRATTLHSSKAIVLVCFAAAMQTPGAIGAVLLLGTVVFPPLLWATESSRAAAGRSYRLLLATQVAAGCWILLQYSAAMPAWSETSAKRFQRLCEWARWLGIACGQGADTISRPQLQRLLVVKVLVLVAVAVKRRSLKWLDQLPSAVRAAGLCGAPCPLFWPVTPEAGDGLARGSSDDWRHLRRQGRDGAFSPRALLVESAPASSLQALAAETKAQARRLWGAFLDSIDWPRGQGAAPGMEPAPSGPTRAPHRAASAEEAGGAEASPFAAAAAGAAGAGPSAAGPSHAPNDAAASARLGQFTALRFAVQDWLETAWQQWNVDLCLLLLLLAAVQSTTVLSLVFLCLLAWAMALPPRRRGAFWRGALIPVLALAVAAQYAVIVGPPPGVKLPFLTRDWAAGDGAARRLVESSGDAALHLAMEYYPEDGSRTPMPFSSSTTAPPLNSLGDARDDVLTWLALRHISRSALWMLFLSYCTAVLQMRYSDWLARAEATTAQPAQRAARIRGAGEGPDAPKASSSRGDDAFPDRPPPPPSVPHLTSAPAGGQPLWRPLTVEAQPDWRWADWARFLLYQHYLDFLLIAVVALCSAEIDVVHAGYLALALYFFRRRLALRQGPHAPFWWLPAYNLLVLAITLLYQTPFETLFDWRPDPDVQACSLPHLLGLFKTRAVGGSLLETGYRGATADVALWVLIRFQTHIFPTQTYADVMCVVAEQEGLAWQRAQEEEAAWKLRQAAAVVESSRRRAARAERVRRLKQGVTASFGRFGVGVSPTALDFAFLEAEEPTSEPNDPLTFPDGGGQASSDEGDDDNGEKASDKAAASEFAAEDLVPEKDLSSKEPPTSSGRQPSAALSFRTAGSDPGDHAVVRTRSSSSSGLESPGASPPPASPPAPKPSRPPPAQSGGSGALVRQLWGRLRRPVRESVLAYVCYAAVFIADCSLLTLYFPLAMFLYALCSMRPSPRFWQVALIYSEFIIIVQYAYQVPSRLGCSFITPQLEYRMEVLGFHRSAVACMPLFVVYLVTLMHTYSLSTWLEAKAQQERAALEARASEEIALCDVEAGGAAAVVNDQGINSGSPGSQASTATGRDSGSKWRAELRATAVAGAASLLEFVLRTATVCERPPYHVLVSLRVPPDMRLARQEDERADDAAGRRACEFIRGELDALRRAAVAAQRRRGGLAAPDLQLHEPVSEPAPLVGEPGGGDDVDGERALTGGGGPDEAPRSRSPSADSLRPASSPNERPSASAQASTSTKAPPPPPDLAAVGPMDLRYVAVVQPAAGDPADMLTVLLEVLPLRGRGGWPLRALSPGETTARALLSQSGKEYAAHDKADAKEDSPPVIVSAENHSRPAKDWYALTAVLDLLAFVYVALFYNKVVASARSLSEITNEHVVPLGYLMTLLTLFMLIVLDRLFYTMGSPLGKAALHAAQMACIFSYCLSLFWSPAASAGARAHLRALMALKCGSFALSAAQLRCGYPPPASYRNGMGRHTFVFMRSVNLWSATAFQVFAAIPFLYELRQLLDWACTPTTLTFQDWLKLEDINVSLYLVAVTRRSRATKPHGQRQPRYSKFFQGTLLFIGLLLLLWVPLLVFSSGNPTYQVPSIVEFGVNVTLSSGGKLSLERDGHVRAEDAPSRRSARAGDGPSRRSARAFPLYASGDRRSSGQWGGDPSSMAPGMNDYDDAQFQLLCNSPDADSYWQLPRPGRASLQGLLQDEADPVLLSFGWLVERDVPPPSDHGGPVCRGQTSLVLADEARLGLLDLLQRGGNASVPILRQRDADEPGNATIALYPRFWHLRGDVCLSQPQQAKPGAAPAAESWDDQWVACNASLEREGPDSDALVWWSFQCDLVDADGRALDAPGDGEPCSASFRGPQIVAVLDRVQGGFIGQTLSKYGIAGLYTIFVYGIGRFLRLSVSNLRMRIPFEDLPNTRRLVALCQDIYIARAEGELALEEELYWALINIYRLPSVMFELTKREKLD